MTRIGRLLGTLLFSIGIVALTSPLSGETREDLVDLPSFRSGSQAFADGRYTTAAENFQTTWSQLVEGEIGRNEQNLIAKRLLEALYRSDATAEMVEWRRSNENFKPSGEVTKLLALAFQKEEQFANAALLFESLIGNDPNANPSLVLSLALCLARSGNPDAGFELIADLTNAPENHFIQMSRIALASDHPKEAYQWILLADKRSASSDTIDRLRILALSRLNRKSEALRSVQAKIENAHDAKEAEKWFPILKELSSDITRPSLSRMLKSWSAKPDHPAQQLAQFYLIVLFTPEDKQAEEFQKLVTDYPEHSLADDIRIEIGETKTENWESAINSEAQSYESTSYQAAARRAYQEVRYSEAITAWLEIAQTERAEGKARSLFNAALAALQAEDEKSLHSIQERMRSQNPSSKLLADLDYFIALKAASKGKPDAFDRLQAFARENPDHPSAVEARIAIAEIYLNQLPARPQPAREILEELRSSPLTLEQNERLDYTSVWTEQTDEDHSEIVRRAGAFLSDWPSSRYVPEILMLLAGNEFRSQHFDSAERHFTAIVDKFPNSSYADAARFFAAKSTTPRKDAIPKWKEMIKEKGSFSDAAQHELGLLYLKSDQFAEAREQLSGLLTSETGSEDLLYATRTDVGFSWYLQALAEEKDANALEEAAKIFAEISTDSTAPTFWRYNAAVRRGKCLEAMGKSDMALEIYRSIVQQKPEAATEYSAIPGTNVSLRERSWIFRAGFSAIEILKAEKDWPAVIQMADALSDEEGPRAIEAAKLAERTRLEHWVWD